MQRIQGFRLGTIAFLTASLVAAMYEVRLAGVSFWGIPAYAVAGFSMFVGGGLARLLVDALLRIDWVRRTISSSAHVEGYWYIQTDGEPSPLTLDGILFLSHEHPAGETKVVTTRINKEGKEYTTASEIAYVRGDGVNLKYLNHFRLQSPDATDSPFGLSSGNFMRSDGFTDHPDRLQALISLTGEGVVRRQSATRISDARVKELQKKFGSEWKAEALSQGRTFVLGRTSQK